MSNYLTINSPTGKHIKFDFRPNCNLVIFTNFNPIRALAFVDMIEQISDVACVTSSHRYDDDTGAITAKLKTGYEKQSVIDGVTEAFEKKFGVESFLIKK